MKVLLQRVTGAGVSVRSENGEAIKIAEIGKGILLFVGFGRKDHTGLFRAAIQKISEIRIFPDTAGRFDKSIRDIKGEILIVSQFTLYGSTAKGRRPDFYEAMPPAEAKGLYENFIKEFNSTGLPVSAGEFGADMAVSLVNDGPVTLMLEFT